MTELYYCVKREYIVPTNNMSDWWSKRGRFFETGKNKVWPNKVERRN